MNSYKHMRGADFADEIRCHLRRVAELSAHLQITDAADGISEVGQAVRARHQQGYVRPDMGELQGNGLKCSVSH